MIFLDFGVDLYQTIKKELILKGIDEREIAFISDPKNDAQKATLFEKCRTGEIRVLIGSTAKMGAGTNIQHRMIALHHLDAPWRPADVEQRNGRILRQGNRFPEVSIFTYVTEQTFDSYLFQILENKQRFISQIMAGKSPARSCEDIDETVLEFAEIKMLTCSDPRLKEKFELDNRLQQLTLEYNSWQQERLRLREFVDSVPKKLAQKEAEHQRVQLDVKQHTAFSEAKFSITIAGKSYSSRTEAGEAFFLLSSQTPIDGTLPLGTFHDFFLSSQRSALFNQLKILVKGHGMYSFDCSDSPLGTMIRLENLLSGLSQEEKKIGEEIAFLNQQKTDAQHQLEVLFHKADELSATRERKTRLDFELSHGKAAIELPSKTNWHLKRLKLPPIALTQQAVLSPIRKNGLSL